MGGEFLLGSVTVVRDPGLFFALMLAIGPGVIVNGVFKPFWGRPRPHDTIPFGGERDFLPVFQKGYTPKATYFAAMLRWASTSWPQRLSSIAAGHGWRRRSCVWG